MINNYDAPPPSLKKNLISLGIAALVLFILGFFIISDHPGLTIAKLFTFNDRHEKCFDYHKEHYVGDNPILIDFNGYPTDSITVKTSTGKENYYCYFDDKDEVRKKATDDFYNETHGWRLMQEKKLAKEKTQPDDPLWSLYPLPWVEDVTVDISKALVAKRIRICGEYKYRQSANDPNKFLVACRPDTGAWTYFKVQVGANDVSEPYQSLADIKD